MQESPQKTLRKARHQSVKNKALGFDAERLYMAEFRDNLDSPFCKTTRNTSRMLDACKVDLNFLPVLIQIKAGIQKGLRATNVLKEMEISLSENYPPSDPIHQMPKLLIHHKEKPAGQKSRTKFESMVTMTFEDFKRFYIAYKNQIENVNKDTKRTN